MKKDILNKIRSASRGQWVRFSIAAVAYTLFIAWVGNWWWILLQLFIFDAYIAKIIPWTWWKSSENKSIKRVMSWVDAILYALIAVYFINNFLFQNYQIPTSSLEKSLLVGDYLFVSKATYGPRIPNTPLSMPLAQHTLPIFDCKSYIDNPQWAYRRLAGIRGVERGDIVVFNFPAGDTVALKEQNPDFHTLAYSAATFSPEYMGTASRDSAVSYAEYQKRLAYGAALIRRNESRFGKVLWRPVDRRENYVKRCVGMPGDTLAMINGQLYINGQKQVNPKKMQMNYFVQTDGTQLTEEILRRLSISVDDRMVINDPQLISYLGFQSNPSGSFGIIYHFPLTDEAYTTLTKLPFVKRTIVEPELYESTVFPLAYSNRWTRDNYGPLWIPARGTTIELTEDNLVRYERAIKNYEGNRLEWKEGRAYLNGQPAATYTFNMDYYFMMGDNRHNSADSRAWGFVPEDHVVGTPLFVWLSIDKDRSWFDGHIRWKRLFTWVPGMD